MEMKLAPIIELVLVEKGKKAHLPWLDP